MPSHSASYQALSFWWLDVWDYSSPDLGSVNSVRLRCAVIELKMASCSSAATSGSRSQGSKSRKPSHPSFPLNPLVEKAMEDPKIGPIECTLLGYDNEGHAFIQLTGKELKRDHDDQMRRELDDLYGGAQGPSLRAKNTTCTAGDVFVAQVFERDRKKFIRVQILEVSAKFVIVNDLDSQMKYEVPYKKLYFMVKELFTIPLLTVKCSLRFINAFAGTTAVVDASKARSCLSTEHFLAKVYKQKRKPGVPLLELYHSPEEYENRAWSFNMDVISQMISWNGGGLDLVEGMVLENVKVIHGLPNGHIWIQFQSGVMDALLKVQPKVNLETIRSLKLKMDLESQLSSGKKLFLMRYHMDENLYVRVRLIGRMESDDINVGEVIVEYYDFGMKEIVHKSDLIPAEYFDSLVVDIPSQVIRANLLNPPYSGLLPEDIALLTSRNHKKKIVIRKLAKGNEKVFPTVEVYVMTQAAARKAKSDAATAPENLSVAGLDCVIHPFPCDKQDVKTTGRMFDYSFNFNKVYQTCKIFPKPTARRT